MKMRVITILLMLVLAPAFAAESLDANKLATSIDKLKEYRYNSTNGVDLRWVERQVGMASKDKNARGQIEQNLIDALAASTTNDAKQFYCRQLRTIGTAKCVPQLAALLTDADMSHMARYALGRIDAPQAGQALQQALVKTSGRLKAGIINTLVIAEYDQALPDIIKLIGDADGDVAVAAIRATGRFGGPQAVKALESARLSAAKPVQLEINGALLLCAENFVADGKNQPAAKIYEEFYNGKYSAQLRVAGLRGLAAARGAGATDLLVEAVKSDDADVSRNAIGMMALVKGQGTTARFIELSKTLSADSQELVVRAMATRGDASAAPSVIELVGSERENVRLAALEALGDIATPQAIGPLAQAAATAPDREKRVAKASLVRMAGAGIDNALIRAIDAGEPKSRIEVISAIGQRNMRLAFGTLHRVAKTEADNSVRREAILSLGKTGAAAELPDVLMLAVAPKDAGDRDAIEKAAVTIFNKIEDPDAQAGPVLTAMKQAPSEAQGVLFNLLTRPATPAAMAAVRAAVKSDDKAVSDVAISALGKWPTAAPADELYQIASTSSNEVQKVLALRSYIRMAPLSDDPPAAYLKALKLAKRDDEVRAVLGGMGDHTATRQMLEVAQKYMADEKFKAEGYQAATKILSRYCWQDNAMARTQLEKIIANAPNNGIRDQARRVINEMDKWKDYIFAWEAVGPYQIKGVRDGNRIFETAFGPEKEPNASLKWKPLKREMAGDQIDLERSFGAVDHACAYLRTTIVSASEQTVKIKWRCDDRIMGWINGEKTTGGDIKLRQGENAFMLKVGDHEGGWSFHCKLEKPDGSPAEGLNYTLK